MALDQPEENQFPYEKNMGFFDHIDELRARLYRVAILVLVGTIAAFFFVEPIFNNIVLSPFKPGFWGNRFFL